MVNKLTHLDNEGKVKMVDISDKNTTNREAIASGFIYMEQNTLDAILEGKNKKGNVLTTAKIAAIMAAKKTHELIPMCHSLTLSSINIELVIDKKKSAIKVQAICKLSGKTGVEMEALTAVSLACLTIYDMCKAIDKNMIIGDICLLEKRGGKSGHWLKTGI